MAISRRWPGLKIEDWFEPAENEQLIYSPAPFGHEQDPLGSPPLPPYLPCYHYIGVHPPPPVLLLQNTATSVGGFPATLLRHKQQIIISKATTLWQQRLAFKKRTQTHRSCSHTRSCIAHSCTQARVAISRKRPAEGIVLLTHPGRVTRVSLSLTEDWSSGIRSMHTARRCTQLFPHAPVFM